MTTPAALRPFRWWDIPAVRSIEEELFPEDPWSVEMFWSELAGIPESRYYVVADARDPARTEPGKPAPHRVVGYAGLMTQAAEHPGATEGWVQNIGVAASYQGRGLGTALLLELLAEAGRRGTAPRSGWRCAPTTTPRSACTSTTASSPSASAAATTSPATTTP